MLEIAESINRKIKAHHRWHIAQNVTATADSEQRTIKLSGRVISWHQKQLAQQIAMRESHSHHIRIIDSIEVA